MAESSSSGREVKEESAKDTPGEEKVGSWSSRVSFAPVAPGKDCLSQGWERAAVRDIRFRGSNSRRRLMKSLAILMEVIRVDEKHASLSAHQAQ